MIKKFISNTIVKCALILVASVFLGFGFLNFVYNLPLSGGATDEHMRESAEIYRDEGSYPAHVSRFSPAALDNFTDALMLLESVDDGKDGRSTAENVIYARFPVVLKEVGTNPRATLVSHYLDGDEYTEYWDYYRYWHGYMIFTRPLLRFFSMHQIRILNMIVQLCLIIFAIYFMYKRSHRGLIAPFIFTWFMLVPITIFKCLQYSQCFYAMMFGLIAILLMKNHTDKKVVPILLITGILTAYFDLLTYPILTLGVPLAAYLYIKNEKSLKTNIFCLLKTSIAWGVGYIGMWAGKWLIGGPEIINSALNQIGFWSESGSGSRLRAIDPNLTHFLKNDLSIFMVIFCTVIATLVYVEIRKKEKLVVKEELKKLLMTLLPYLLIALMPFVWYIFAVGHSSHHAMFTFRALGVTTFALMVGLVQTYRRVKSKK